MSQHYGTKIISYPRVKNEFTRAILSVFVAFRILPQLFRNDTLIAQFPPKFEEIPSLILCQKLRRKTIFIVHDLDHLRGIKNTGLRFFRDPQGLKMLRNSQVVIQDGPLQEYLETLGVKQRASFEIWPYLLLSRHEKTTNSFSINDKYISTKIIYAGNLDFQKSAFLAEVEKLRFKFFLYGKLSGAIQQTKWITIMNSFRDGSPPAFPDYAFGLVWDGDSILKLSGVYGEYSKMNLPAKLSLYIACEIPVIVSNQSAVAQYVKTNQIGITVDSLFDIPKQFNINDWNTYKRNITRYSDQVRKGFHLVESLKDLI